METYKRLYDKDVAEYYDNMRVDEEGSRAGIAMGIALLLAIATGALLYFGTLHHHQRTAATAPDMVRVQR